MYAVTVAVATLFALASALPTPQDESGPQVQPPEVTPVPLPTPLPSVGLHPNGNAQKCVDVRGGVIQAGTVVQIYDCNGTDAQKFSLKRGDGQVFVTGTNYCLDVGSSPGNGAQVKLARCNKSLLQNWYYTDDDRLAVTGKGNPPALRRSLTTGLCLDLTNGSDENGNALQVWECGTGNTNQVWTTNVLLA